MNPTTIVIDGDVLVWKVAVVSQENIDFGDGDVTSHPNEDMARHRCDGLVRKWMNACKATGAVVTLSDVKPGVGRRYTPTWRHALLPSYKQHRPNKESKQPPLMLYDFVRNHILNEYTCEILPNCEADDVMGVVCTNPAYDCLGDRIIVSIDKDMKQIPGMLYNPDKNVTVTVTPEEADRWHFYQAFVGDTCDNFKGCPGVGPAKTERILAAAEKDAAENGRSVAYNRWLYACMAFRQRGVSIEEQLVQFRIARILRFGEWDYKTQTPILWEPPKE